MDYERKGVLSCLGLSLSSSLLPIARTSNNRTSVICRCVGARCCPTRTILLRTALTSDAGRHEVRVRPISHRLKGRLVRDGGLGSCYIFMAGGLGVGMVSSFEKQGSYFCCGARGSSSCMGKVGVVPLTASSLHSVVVRGGGCDRLFSEFICTCGTVRGGPLG